VSQLGEELQESTNLGLGKARRTMVSEFCKTKTAFCHHKLKTKFHICLFWMAFSCLTFPCVHVCAFATTQVQKLMIEKQELLDEKKELLNELEKLRQQKRNIERDLLKLKIQQPPLSFQVGACVNLCYIFASV
jgi:hypothetical protein